MAFDQEVSDLAERVAEEFNAVRASIIVLEAADSIPGGTPTDAIIVRKT